jgi:hypothetical protein
LHLVQALGTGTSKVWVVGINCIAGESSQERTPLPKGTQKRKISLWK